MRCNFNKNVAFPTSIFSQIQEHLESIAGKKNLLTKQEPEGNYNIDLP